MLYAGRSLAMQYHGRSKPSDCCRAVVPVLCVTALIAAPLSSAFSNIDAVYISPSSPDNTHEIIVRIYGWYPCFNTYPQGATVQQWGDTIHITSHAITDGGFCLPTIRYYYDSLHFGPLAPGDYTVIVSDSTPDYEYLALTVSSNPDCCQGRSGNVDGSFDDVVDISDLVCLMDYMFDGGPTPPCLGEADIDGSVRGVIDISDLVHLVDYMFSGGIAPAKCP